MEKHGIEVKMVTGDNLAIAREIGGLLGLKQQTMQSQQLSGSVKHVPQPDHREQ